MTDNEVGYCAESFPEYRYGASIRLLHRFTHILIKASIQLILVGCIVCIFIWAITGLGILHDISHLNRTRLITASACIGPFIGGCMILHYCWNYLNDK